MAQRARLSADDWADAALAAIAEGGVPAVAVEPLAVRLGTTKGSFYWHFPNRDALVVAALARWEHRYTTEVIDKMDREPDPVTRLHSLFSTVIAVAERDRTEVALLASADHPAVAPVLARVTARRVDYTADLFVQLGYSPQEARLRGVLAFSAYLGYAQLLRAAPQVLPADSDAYRRLVGRLLAG
ncbi:TetR/AcrR family transcriptional regulator [Candidatus Protofrankia californiensis]|uniref:TetR/AcrR family transcriptional regulator n=1 Tax=Candidatus Protofrankia californiensis TaxID=1839754 RepID=UPI001041340F